MRDSKITYRLVVFIAVFIFGVAFSLPSFLQSKRGVKINLEPDLQGRLYMLLGVDNQGAIRSKIKSVASSLSYSFNKENILNGGLNIHDDSLDFTLLGNTDIVKIEGLFREIDGLNAQREDMHYTIPFTSEKVKSMENFTLLQAVETIRNRLDQFGLAEPTIARQGRNKILVELAGIKTKEDELRAKEHITKAAHLQLMKVDDSRMNQASNMSDAKATNYGLVLVPDSRNPNLKCPLKNIPILDDSMLTDARVGLSDTSNHPVVSFTLNAEGSRKFADYIGTNVGKRLAIVFDNKVYSAPSINEHIGGGSGRISGAFIQERARDVAMALRGGALLAPVRLLEQRSIGPSLDADSIKMSMIALIGVSVFIVIFTMLYYGTVGIFANIAMLVNALVAVTAVAMFDATLTLPDMAGLVLTTGMVVDANVIINERIRELLRESANVKASIEQSYKNAMSTIIDSNITSLITSIALYAYGTGTVKGSAVTLEIGIVVSTITIIWEAHGMFGYFTHRIERSNNTRFWFGYRRR